MCHWSQSASTASCTGNPDQSVQRLKEPLLHQSPYHFPLTLSPSWGGLRCTRERVGATTLGERAGATAALEDGATGTLDEDADSALAEGSTDGVGGASRIRAPAAELRLGALALGSGAMDSGLVDWQALTPKAPRSAKTGAVEVMDGHMMVYLMRDNRPARDRSTFALRTAWSMLGPQGPKAPGFENANRWYK